VKTKRVDSGGGGGGVVVEESAVGLAGVSLSQVGPGVPSTAAAHAIR